MSAFDNYLKDDIVHSIKEYVSDLKENKPDLQYNEIIKEVMEAVSYGLEKSFWEIENK